MAIKRRDIDHSIIKGGSKYPLAYGGRVDADYADIHINGTTGCYTCY